ncbi:MAG: EF2563 family selenium-dependent molybdenum hydroxylase system protein [Treponema sp.]|jgi:xanthine dehydrogenase accessory factor|nr:EF2563 family selenium-dependent molybdenum hydroxylase system protein [Treponema sp.]
MLVLIKGAGDLASGAALRLRHAGFEVAMTELPRPLAVRRTVCFSQAVYDGRAMVEDVAAALVRDEAGMRDCLAGGRIAVFVDPEGSMVKRLAPEVLVDAIMAKKNTGTTIRDAPVVIALGPGFTAGVDCHAVIETMRGHTLGRVITEGGALPNTGVPGSIAGFDRERLLRAPADGVFEPLAAIGDRVRRGDLVALVRSRDTAGARQDTAAGPSPAPPAEIRAAIDGLVRGLLPPGAAVKAGMKAGDIDPRCEGSHCFTVSDKALAVAGGVLEAVLRFAPLRGRAG